VLVEPFDQALRLFSGLRFPQDLIDIGIVAFVIYRVLLLLSGTRAMNMVFGVLLIASVAYLSSWSQLYAINWLLSHVWTYLLLAIVIIFQPEIRRALANVGQGPILSGSRAKGWERSLDALVTAAATLADQRIGALIAIERSTPLGDLIEIGTPLNATLSKELLKAIFSHGSPIHDGAVLVREGEVVAAGCFLPIKLSADIAQELGTRHRAAIGLTAESDAVVIVVSEETGALGLAVEGRVLRNLDPARLHARLTDLLTPSAAPRRRWLPWRSRAEAP
jgi:diadenylate cyclase